MRRRTIALTAALVLPATVGGSFASESAVVQAATVPAGFVDNAVATFNGPTAVEWLPSGHVVVLERTGAIRIGRPGQAFETSGTIPVCATAPERGLLGFTAGPAFLGNGHVFVYYTRTAPGAPGGCVNRVSRFTIDRTTLDPASEVVLLDNISSVNGNHNGGDLDMGSDGYLYVSVGDAGRDPRGNSGSAGANDAAQDLSLLNGKILRITVDGAPAPGNPLTGAGTAACATRGNTASTPTTMCQEIFAWGLRNPYRFAFDRNDGSDRFFINDVGQGTREEVDLGKLGANYGWPAREGACPQGDEPPCTGPESWATDPITDYGRSTGTVITGGAFVPDGLWPSEYDGDYLFGDAGSGNIWRYDGTGPVDYDTPFATGADALSDMTFGFDATGRSALYYVSSAGELRAITPTSTPGSSVASDLAVTPVEPFRAYDTANNIGVTKGDVVNGTTRMVDLTPPAGAKAALVNLTLAFPKGPGHITTWAARGLRPATSNVNHVDPLNQAVANTAIVPLDDQGRFVFEAANTGRVVIDVMGWMMPTTGPVSAGRYVALPPARLADTRHTAGIPLGSGSPNQWTRAGNRIDVTANGLVGIPPTADTTAVLLGVVAIGLPGPGGWVGGHPGGDTWNGTSNVNVGASDVRANMVMIPTDSTGKISFELLNIDYVVVDVLGYVTSNTATASTSGLYDAVDPVRIVDTRVPLPAGFHSFGADETQEFEGGPISADWSAVSQNVTITQTSQALHLTVTTGGVEPAFVSTVNATGPAQTRAAYAMTTLSDDAGVAYTALHPTHLVVDVFGGFGK